MRFEIEVFDAAGWQRFWALLDADETPTRRGWQPFQHRYATATCPLPDELHQAAGRHRFAAVDAAAAAAGVSILRLRDVAERGAERAAGLPPWRITAIPDGTPGLSLPCPPTTAQLPLEGLVVVEACRRLQCSARFLALNRGKDVVEIDLKSTAGRRAVQDLVAGADVFVHNWAPGKAGQLELDAGHLAAVRPGLVYAYASGWGNTFGAAPPLGTDFMVQAYSGLAAMVRPSDEPPAPSLMTLTDVLGGLICAQGVLAGLLARIRTGSGQRVDSSLLSAAMVIQQPRAGRPVWTPLHRPLATADGYVALSTRTRMEPDRVAAACGVGSGFEAIAARFRQEPSHTWVERLSDAGLAGIPVCTSLAALATDPRFAPALQHDICTFTRPPWEFS